MPVAPVAYFLEYTEELPVSPRDLKRPVWPYETPLPDSWDVACWLDEAPLPDSLHLSVAALSPIFSKTYPSRSVLRIALGKSKFFNCCPCWPTIFLTCHWDIKSLVNKIDKDL